MWRIPKGTFILLSKRSINRGSSTPAVIPSKCEGLNLSVRNDYHFYQFFYLHWNSTAVAGIFYSVLEVILKMDSKEQHSADICSSLSTIYESMSREELIVTFSILSPIESASWANWKESNDGKKLQKG